MIIIATLYQNSLRVQRLVKVGKNGTRICSMSFLNGEEGAPDKPCGVGRADANPKLLLNDT